MKKYIHYCWFGGNIKSWKKYLPDYEIIEWNEKNVDLQECSFIKEAYESKMWAFVADYVRTKALNDMGGIYFDTDMEVIKNIDFLFENDTFLGVEDSGKIAVGVWYEKKAKSYLSTKLLKFYRSCDGFDSQNAYAYSIPKIITDLVVDDNFVIGSKKIQKLSHNIVIYPREYFYPYSYDRQDNVFTNNTCMIHYYDASWIPKAEQRENKIFRLLGKENGQRFINISREAKRNVKRLGKLVLFPLVIKRSKEKKLKYFEENKKILDDNLKKIKKNQVLVFYRNGWLGTSYATKEMFEDAVGINALFDNDVINYYADEILKKQPRLIIFSAFDLSWSKLIEVLKEKKPKQRIKVMWHGSNAMNVEEYDWNTLRTIIEYCRYGIIESIGFVKKSMYEFYKTKNVNCEFVMNTLSIDKNEYNLLDSNNKNVKIGVYASGDRWVKNFYNQLSAASMIKNHLIDCVPRTTKTIEFASLIDANVIGESKPIPRDELLKRIADNDINIYVTFVECAPLLPLESMELGVPCITANNHHYWEGTELEKYLVVNAPDNIIEIKNKIELVLKNKEEIMKLYVKWKKGYDNKAKKNLEKFVK